MQDRWTGLQALKSGWHSLPNAICVASPEVVGDSLSNLTDGHFVL